MTTQTRRMDNRKQYQSPSITAIGNVESLTAGTVSDADYSDFSYPAGTPSDKMKWYSKH